MSKKNQTTPRDEDNANWVRLYVSIELSLKKWKLGFSDGRQARARVVRIEAKDWERFGREVEKAKERFGLKPSVEVWSCYEAGREGFWVHRALERLGIRNRIVESASIEVNRRQRRVKSDRVDAEKLVRGLVRWGRGERDPWSIVRVPSEEAEDGRQLHRELEILKRERQQHRVRIQSLLFTQGIDLKVGRRFLEQLDRLRNWKGEPIRSGLRDRLEREYHRLELLKAEIGELRQLQRKQLESETTAAIGKVRRLVQLRGIGVDSGWVTVMECFGWRQFQNRREVGAALGLTPTPYDSGQDRREQGISKAGNKRMRRLAVQMAWSWLRFQPDSRLSRWYRERFASGGPRTRKVGIVALTRKLMIALWRYLEFGEVPEGARMKLA